ncbi:LysR family transcriptional regulator [Paenibacillus rhizophilus]|uniref:LysR family transcriptional regulator n=1 Tax=Paenibacillus rhizophilus TaxID=1850366 RepID=A0A3N9PF80_9BACL|nr:LysR family transcriptional regulator [Paenibacillus rhizophilus]RQW13694.1 LysR family transcriptional regulator [Paenibacillus rhizophilus]
MEWQQLEYFEATARLQHMTLAAQTLNITQPALSRSIARLETELGIPLFEREGRSIRLNRYGQLFLSHVEHILEEFRMAKREIDDLLNPSQGEVSLGFLHTLGIHHIPDLIGKFRRAHPHTRFQLHQSSTHRLLEQLVSGEIDLCMASPRDADLRIRWARLWSEELFLAVPAGHRLAGSSQAELCEIAQEPLISFKEGYGLRIITDNLLQESGIAPPIVFEGEDVDTVAGLVAAGLGVAILPKYSGLDQEELFWVSVENQSCRREIGIAWMEDRFLSPAAERFRQFVLDFYLKE